MSHRRCSKKSDCKCVKCCEPPPQCKVIECPQFTCSLGAPDEDNNKPLGTVFADPGTGKLFVNTPDGVREIALVPV